MERLGPIAYRLALTPSLQGIHEVFHVSNLRKYIPDPDHIIEYGPVEIRSDLSFPEEHIWILEWQERRLRTKIIRYVKVLWKHHKGDIGART